jgi:hypothetical protein
VTVELILAGRTMDMMEEGFGLAAFISRIWGKRELPPRLSHAADGCCPSECGLVTGAQRSDSESKTRRAASDK